MLKPGPGLWTVSLCAFSTWGREEGRGDAGMGEGKLDDFLTEMKIYKVTAERNVAASEYNTSRLCRAGYK